jgi:hypothetical protein
MKKNIIATLVGTLIIFLWQGFSWMASPIHHSAYKQTSKQDEILQALQGLEGSGAYIVPGHSNETDNANQLGKPWALIGNGLQARSLTWSLAGCCLACLRAGTLKVVLQRLPDRWDCSKTQQNNPFSSGI